MTRSKRQSRAIQAPKAAAIYCRISDDREGEGLGVARQEEDCRALAKRLGWVVAGLYVDNDISAFKGKVRPDYRRLLEDIRTGAVDGLISWHPDRVHRSPRELEEFIDIVEAARILIATVQGGQYDLTTAAGRGNARIVGAVARMESEHKSERIRRKHEQLAKQGRRSGGSGRAFGYSVELETPTPNADGKVEGKKVVRKLTICEPEAKLIRDGARRVLAGESVRSVTRRWAKSGLKTSTGKAWIASGVRNVLNSARIAGLREYEEEFYKANWPGVISREEWERLRALLSDPLRRTNRIARKYLLAGLLHCSMCGQKLVARPRAAECAWALAQRGEIARLRDQLGELRKAIAGGAGSDLKRLEREQASTRKQREKLMAALGAKGPHVVLSQLESMRTGKDRACTACGAPAVSEPTYVCASGPGFGGCGKIRRDAAAVEDIVGQLAMYRIDGPELRQAMREQERRETAAAPVAGGIPKLERKRDQLAEDFAAGRISRREWLVARDAIQAQLNTLQAVVRRDQRTTALAPYLDGKGALAKRWPALAVDERRAILAVVLDQVKVHPAVRGRSKFDPALIEPIWRL